MKKWFTGRLTKAHASKCLSINTKAITTVLFSKDLFSKEGEKLQLAVQYKKLRGVLKKFLNWNLKNVCNFISPQVKLELFSSQ